MEERCWRCGSLKHTTEEHMRRMAEGRRKSSIWKEAHAKGNAKKRGRPLVFSDPEARARKIRESLNSPEGQERLSAGRKKQWEDKTEAERAAIGAKISKAQKGRKLSEEHLANLRAANSKPRSEEHKTKLANARRGQSSWNAGLTKFDNASLMSNSLKQQGRIPDYNKYRAHYEGPKGRILMRSRWEVAYAEYLDRKQIDWLYEPRFFVIGDGAWNGHTYTPDFYLIASDEYIEIKGRMTEYDANKIAKFRELYPEILLTVLEAQEMKAIGLVDKHRRLIDSAGNVLKRM